MLKQQWTIKISSPFFLFSAWRPSWLEVGITGHIFGRGSSKDHSTKVWLQLAQTFLRRRLKCEMLTDGRRTTDDGRKVMAIAHMTQRPVDLKISIKNIHVLQFSRICQNNPQLIKCELFNLSHPTNSKKKIITSWKPQKYML